jgi:hypothetical protein
VNTTARSIFTGESAAATTSAGASPAACINNAPVTAASNVNILCSPDPRANLRNRVPPPIRSTAFALIFG